MDLETQVAVVCERVKTVEAMQLSEKQRLNGNLERIAGEMKSVTEALHSIKDELNEKLDKAERNSLRSAAGKPTWGTTIALTTLTGLVASLATYIVTHL